MPFYQPHKDMLSHKKRPIRKQGPRFTSAPMPEKITHHVVRAHEEWGFQREALRSKILEMLAEAPHEYVSMRRLVAATGWEEALLKLEVTRLVEAQVLSTKHEVGVGEVVRHWWAQDRLPEGAGAFLAAIEEL